MPHGTKNIECGFEIKTILSIRYISQLTKGKKKEKEKKGDIYTIFCFN
jgi:hypothetical protein